ncbi:hypothetical protein CCE28_11460 [Anaeromicrobium sediminis]|uniref:Choline/carnitine acyltransferase domain-containing protein n=1 Tax=Anaeromicrobium sediminis TaxID=1478221 RepID=A0A267MJN5_9FIRM|nr:hypothetical protein CCE28_11460 [Anaeromicrobium sediminis]
MAGFAPVEHYGFGIWYGFRDEKINLCIVSRKNMGVETIKKFSNEISRSLKVLNDFIISY